MSIIDKSHKLFEEYGSRLIVNYNDNYNDNHLPSWFNLNKFKKIKPIINKYFFSIFFAHLSGLLILVFIRTICDTLSATGKSKDLSKTFLRYLHTCFHVKNWYEGELWNKNHSSYKSLKLVKSMHQTTSDQQNKYKSDENIKSISMRDMTLTQFAFAGLLILYPHKYGFSRKRSDIEILIYFWSVIGYMLGIDDDYNLFIGDYETVRKRCKEILDKNFRPSLSIKNKDSIIMAKNIIISSNQYIYGLRYGSYMKFIFKSIDIDNDCQSLFELNGQEKFFYYLTRLIMEKLYYFFIIRFLLNQLLRFSLFTMRFQYLQQCKIQNLNQIKCCC